MNRFVFREREEALTWSRQTTCIYQRLTTPDLFFGDARRGGSIELYVPNIAFCEIKLYDPNIAFCDPETVPVQGCTAWQMSR